MAPMRNLTSQEHNIMSTTQECNFNVRYNVGKARYVVNFHDGVTTHADGSAFYNMRILNNKRDLNAFVASLKRSGYTPR